MKRPSSTASEMIRHINEPERMASSLPGMTYCTRSGSQFVSTTATTGMPSLFASVTPMCSFLVSSTKTASGRFVRLRMPPRLRCSFSSSRVRMRASFFGMTSNSPDTFMRSYSFILSTRLEIVSKLVSMPPSQRSLMYGMPHFSAKPWIGSWACFLVPMNRMVPPSATRSRTNEYADSMRVSVWLRSMM